MDKKGQLTVILTVIGIVGAFVAVFAHGQMIQDGHNKQLVQHMHMRLLFTDGRVMPAGIGISQNLWVDRTFDSYGIGGVAPMHTHLSDSVIHIEANAARNWTLGEFVDVWGVPLNGEVFVGEVQLDDWRNHVFVDKETITVKPSEFEGPEAN